MALIRHTQSFRPVFDVYIPVFQGRKLARMLRVFNAMFYCNDGIFYYLFKGYEETEAITPCEKYTFS